jgi:hypothetical protein
MAFCLRPKKQNCRTFPKMVYFPIEKRVFPLARQDIIHLKGNSPANPFFPFSLFFLRAATQLQTITRVAFTSLSMMFTFFFKMSLKEGVSCVTDKWNCNADSLSL